MRRLLCGWALAALLWLPAHAAAPAFDIALLDAAAGDPPPATLAGGSLDARFGPYSLRDARRGDAPFWLRLTATTRGGTDRASAMLVAKGRHLDVRAYARAPGGAAGVRALDLAAELPEFSATQTAVFVLPRPPEAGDVFYARVNPTGQVGSEVLRFDTAPLDRALARGAEHARMIALAFGALMAVAIAALLTWFVLKERIFILYGGLFALQALYVAYLSGEGFDWPGFDLALPLASHAWNVPAALSGAAACLFVREIADLRRYSRRVYRTFGAFAALFVVLAFSNFLSRDGFGGVISAIGNLLFVGTAAFTLIVAWLAWRRGSRPAGWFLLAWVLLEAFTIATALKLLLTNAEEAEFLLYYGLPLSMVAAAILIALGVADRVREQRAALSLAERRAQTDPLTGVLNRRSLVERLDAACARAQARGLPIALLFIDLDHFKGINDTFGHPAGDACLAAIIAPIQAELRQSDVIGRFGGEEFVVILSSADTAAAQLIAQRIRERVAEVVIGGYGVPIRLTCSIGVATSETLGVWGEHLIAQADAAVYAAKRAGRNRVQVAQPIAA
ncbi:MAG: diguanylate cyclase [Steroidobacteraceae bacterium]